MSYAPRGSVLLQGDDDAITEYTEEENPIYLTAVKDITGIEDWRFRQTGTTP